MKLPKELNYLLAPDDWPGVSAKEDARVYRVAGPIVRDIIQLITQMQNTYGGVGVLLCPEDIIDTISNRYSIK